MKNGSKKEEFGASGMLWVFDSNSIPEILSRNTFPFFLLFKWRSMQLLIDYNIFAAAKIKEAQ